MREIDYSKFQTTPAVPEASSMIETFRAIGYNIETAVADIIDNSISANAKNIWANFYLYSGIKKADVTAPNGAVFTFTYESFTDTYICYLGGEKAERAAALFDVVDLYDAISRSITTVRKYGGWVEHTVTPAWRLPIVGSEVTFKIT